MKEMDRDGPRFGKFDSDNGYGDSVSTDDEDKQQDDGPEEEIQLWDSFKCTEPQARSGSMVEKRWYEVILRVIKTFLYGFLCFSILVGSIVSKGATLFATSQLSETSVPFCDYYPGRNVREQYRYVSALPKEARPSWFWCIIIAFSIPEVLDFLLFFWNCFFVDIAIPKTRNLILLSFIEILHVIGLALLFLIVLPDLDVLQGAATLCCVCIVPSILGLLSRFKNRTKKGELQSSLHTFGDFVASLTQIGGLIALTHLNYKNEKISIPWMMPIAIILSSLRWWGNYVSHDSNFNFINYLAKARRNLQSYRSVLIGYTSLLRVITFILSSLVIAYYKGIEPKDFFNGFWMNDYNFTVDLVNVTAIEGSEVIMPSEQTANFPGDRWTPLNVALIHGIAGICVYNSSKFACKTLMQGFGFALPLNLALPGTMITIWILCAFRDWDACSFHSGNRSIDALDYLFFRTPNIRDYISNWYAWTWMIWVLSQSWITMHVWFTRNERLATTSRIFAVSSYDSLLLDQSLALSRWRDEPDDDDDIHSEQYDDVEEPDLASKNSTMIREEDKVTKIYACATMWHETPEEMTDFLNSILRLDRDQCIMRLLKKGYEITSPDYYELEVHIFFDDAFRCKHGCTRRCLHDERLTEVNDWVIGFVETVKNCIRSRNLKSSPPIKFPTPYGGRLVWTLPEKTKMYVHLKDKNRIRTRKRWSQVMYMYYLLGYRLMELPIDVERKEVMAENTYILTLDGDIDFRPSAVRILVDRMKINKDLGSVCGRIHPLGKGPMVWFQKFEYAIGHWLQKSTEHTIGSVLCSPGCFALFRAKALMDYNVMRKYATIPKEAKHFIQYDQGEDRWLCTLVLQMGYKVEYSAASDAYTHAPEKFHEFYIQRRRWIPSTVANIFDLLETAGETKKANRDISWLYIFYQWVLMGSTILGPGTIFLMLVGAFVAAFPIDNWSSFGYNLIPIVIFCGVCYYCKEPTQLIVAGLITAVYGLVMVIVLVGIMLQIAEDGWLAPSTLLFFVVGGQLVITGFLHPLEWTCLLYGVAYYVTVPSMYMLLIIFSLFNMNNISWGTRDAPKNLTPEEEQQEAAKNNKTPAKKTKNEKGPVEFSIAGLFKCILCAQEQPRENDSELKDISSVLNKIVSRLDEIERTVDNGSRTTTNRVEISEDALNSTNRQNQVTLNIEIPEKLVEKSKMSRSNGSSDIDSEIEDDEAESIAASSHQENDNFLVSPNWLHGKRLGKGEVEYLSSEEEVFWNKFIGTYLYPIDKDEKREEDIAHQITELRDQYIFKFFMINALFVLSVFLLQLNKEQLHFQWPLGVKYNVTYESGEVNITKGYLRLEPIGCLFIIGFISILGVQFIAMLFHRFETFSHIMAKVSLDWYCCDRASDLTEEAIIERHAEKIKKELQRQIDNDIKPVGHNSTIIPPRRRQTIHNAVTSNDRKQPFAQSFSSTLKQTLQQIDHNETSGIKTKRMSQTALRLLQKRRSTIYHRRQSQRPTILLDNNYASVNDSINPNLARRSTVAFAGYDNAAFIPETFTIEENEKT